MNLSTLAAKSRVYLKDAGAFGPSILLRRVLPRDAHGVVSLRTRFGRIHFRPADSDMSVLRQVFVRKDYDLNRYPQGERIRKTYDAILAGGNIPLIIDAGANIGAVSMWFSMEFPESRIIAIEPSPGSIRLCRRNCEGYQNVTCVEGAVGSEAGSAKLENPDAEAWAIPTLREDGADIEISTIENLLSHSDKPFELFIVKIDIEGFERDLFASNIEWLSQVAVVIIEPHDWMLPGRYSSQTFQKAMFAHNFEIVISGENLVFVR